ncbi:MAG: TetR/AcrR family transcriptional regulator [Ilumatobacter sp.]|nr:TetR/AcrR family transcriptional regulator [Ilumatobacter sp.]
MAVSPLRERNRRAAMTDVQRVAVQLMRQHGFGNVTVEQIADAAGVSASTTYRYFGTKEALVLWGDRSERLVAALAAAPVGDDSSPGADFAAAAIAVYAVDEGDLLAQLRLVFANEPLAVAFEHRLLGRRGEVADILARRRAATSVGVRDDAGAGAYLGMLIAVLTRWQAADGAKSLSKMLVKASAVLRD